MDFWVDNQRKGTTLRAIPPVAPSQGRTGSKLRRRLPTGQTCSGKLWVPRNQASLQAKRSRALVWVC
ncbi:unnamed protein product [Prunus armeniaca]